MEVDKYAELYKRRNQHRFKKKYVFLLIAIIAVLTNPSQEKHQNAVKAKFDNYIRNYSGSALSLMQGNPFVDQTIIRSVNSTNYLFFSTTNVAWDNDTHIIGFGIFGKVFISSSVDLYLNSKYN
ncbi:MAG: hypothetical protein LBL79_07480 [Prevotella sp.]|jgi:hypothetical protein|nr:hypothetical protein [Prevotella sp.]